MARFEGFHDPLEKGGGSLSSLPEADPDIHASRVKRNAGVISRVDKLTYDTFEIGIKCEPGSAPLAAIAGQYGAISHPDISKPRSYSFARAPEDESQDEHTFFIRLVPGGELSGWLAAKDRVGERMSIAGPLGNFKLDASKETMVCIAGGSGMSAIKAILEHAGNKQVERDALFFYGARTQEDLYCQEEMEALKKRWHKDFSFNFVPVLSEEPDGSDWQGPRGFVTDYFKNAYLDQGKVDINQCKAYFCGPPPMIDAGVDILKSAGLKDKNIFFDKFEDASSPAPVIDNSKCVLCDECLLVKPVANCIVEISNLHFDANDQISGYDRVQPAYTSGLYYNTLFIDKNECIRCFACVDACPHDAISTHHSRRPDVLRQLT